MGEKRSHKSVRLPFMTYAEPGIYFVTLCTANRAQLFGEIQNGQMVLNDAGRIVQEEWRHSCELRAELVLDEFIVMPDHLHGLVGLERPDDELNEWDRAHSRAALQTDPLRGSRDRTPRSLSSFVAQFKATTTRLINEYRRSPSIRVWQPSFYEHIMRHTEKLDKARHYILRNPERWKEDRENSGIFM